MIWKKDFLLLWFVSSISTLGTELFMVTILVTVFQQTESTLQAAGVMVAKTVSAFLLGPIAGVFVDRFRRKHVLMSMDGFRLLLILGMTVFLLGRGKLPIIVVYLILIGISAAGVFHYPARLSMIPSVVDKAELVKANSIILVSGQVMMATAYALGGWIVLNIPIRQIGFGVVLLFGFGIMATGLMHVSEREEKSEGEKESVWGSFMVGWAYLKDHPIARPLTIMETIEHVPHGIWTQALILTFVIQGLKGDAADWGYVVTGYFVGMIGGSLGTLFMGNWLRYYPGRMIVLTASISGLLTLAFASSQSIFMAVMWGFMFGPPFAIRDVAQDSLLQGSVGAGKLGRIYATREMLRSVVFMISGLFFAWLTAFVSIRVIYVIGGCLYLLTGMYALSSKSLRESKMDFVGDQ